MRIHLLLLFALFCMFSRVNAQSYTSGLKGIVLDRETKAPLEGATVQLITETLQPVGTGTYTNVRGEFEISNLQVGRVAVRITYVGYQERIIPNILIVTGRVADLNVDMSESLREQQAVEIVAGTQDEQRQPQNEFAAMSARSFNVEQTQRFAGSLNDPTRMAANFAGVSGGGDTRNDIVIRGNSPLGMLWRLEGIDIPNPNHFASQGANGGPISMINNNMLATSDFFTGAFPAEYGNATSGVFDLKLRNGNSSRRQHLFQIGFSGIEAMTEGYFKKGYAGSYVINYRYSTLDAFNAVGIKFGDLLGIPRFQDLSFRVNLPAGRFGTFSLFGLGGISNINVLESDLTDEKWNEIPNLSYTDVRQRTTKGSAGLQHRILLGDKTVLTTTAAVSIENRRLQVDTLFLNRTGRLQYGDFADNQTQTLSLQLTHKFNPRHVLRVSAMADRMLLDAGDSLYQAPATPFRTLRRASESTGLLRASAQWQWRASEKVTLTNGVSYIRFLLNGSQAVEPRSSIKYQFTAAQSLSLGYGMHNQIQPLLAYYNQDGVGGQPNRSLNLTQSQHLVLGYESRLGTNMRLKAEGYYQWLNNIPVQRTASSFAMINAGVGFNRFPDAVNLANTGTAYNYGIELTLERFYANNYYFLATASVFQSKYKGSDGVERNTAFANNYVINLLGGYELPVGREKQNALYVDIRTAFAGGIRYTPVDLAASQAAGATVLTSDVFSAQTRPYFRPDLKFGYRRNSKRFSQDFGVTLQNVVGYPNVLTVAYNPRRNELVEFGQLNFFPVVQYQLRF